MTVQSKTMSVQIREGRLRTTPSFLGKIIGSVRYGDRVAVLEEKSSWLLVSPPDADRGWIHQSALTVKKIVLRPGEEDVRKAATTDEIALAGKGFNRQVEDEFRSRHPSLDYTGLDRMEAFQVSQPEVWVFLKEGKLEPGGGDR